jgi:hypothetical protein
MTTWLSAVGAVQAEPITCTDVPIPFLEPTIAGSAHGRSHPRYAIAVTTKAWLAGHRFDLETLATHLSSGDVRVIEENENFYLSAPQLDNPPPGKTFFGIARELLVWVNGVGFLMGSGFSPVELTDHYDRDDGVHIVGATATLTARGHMTATATVLDTNGHPVPSPPPVATTYLSLATTNPDAAEVLEFLAKPGGPSFSDLYKILEIVEHTGHSKAAMQSAGISKATMTRFTRTANHQAVSGSESRHARLSERPPKNPMTIDEARTTMRQLVTEWFNFL